MGKETKRINRSLMIEWMIIVVILFAAYWVEFFKNVREFEYVMLFDAITIIPCVICAILYLRKRDSERLRYYIVAGYFLMYAFVLFTGKTYMVSCYILPLLSMLILYHQPKLMAWTGVTAIIFSVASIVDQYLKGMLTIESSMNVEIQIAVICLCCGFGYLSCRIHDSLYKQNQEFLAELEEKNLQTRLMTMQTIMTIVNTIDAKDEYTKGHSQRVSEYTAALAEEMGYEAEQVEKIRYIALLHDIGKIGVPDSILNKPGHLSNAEFSLMRLHTMVGGEILKDIVTMEELGVGAKYHHERYDGTGYPEGLKGENIPKVARMIGIADAYDAMTSHRVYRKRLSDEAVRAEIKKCSGTQFDPEIAKAFLHLLEKGVIQGLSPDKYIAPDGSSEAPSHAILKLAIENAEEDIDKEDQKDSLTGTYNHTCGERLLQEFLENDGEGSLLLVDTDALRIINSMYGFLKGDLYLNAVAKTLMGHFPNAMVYRSSGDEFVCLLSGVTSKTALNEQIEAFYEKLEKLRAESEELSEISVSIGGLILKAGEYQKNAALVRAERALYFAKQRGVGSHCMYHELNADFRPNLSKDDLNNFLQTVQKQRELSRTYEVNYPEFGKMLDYLERVTDRNQQHMQVIMFTLLAVDEESIQVEEKLNTMRILESAINASLRKVDVSLQFSSSQRIVVLPGLDEENIQIVANRIMSAFYKRMGDKRFTLAYDIGDLNAHLKQKDKISE